jgi:exodeoxyribonuclease-3
MAEAFSLVTWNVNSIRARLDNVLTYLDEADPDVVCLQETKVEDKLFPRVPFMEMGYRVHLNGTKGYAGVATMTKAEAEDVHAGFRHGEPDQHRRILSLRVHGVRIYNLYAPNGTAPGTDKYAYKLAWFEQLRDELDACWGSGEEEVLLCGDFNIAPDERDIWDPSGPATGTHYNPEVHAALDKLKGFGLQDCFRKHNDEAAHYTWFDYRNASFERGHGMRIDHVYVTEGLYGRNQEVAHDREPRTWDTPSDHLPVRARFGA